MGWSHRNSMRFSPMWLSISENVVSNLWLTGGSLQALRLPPPHAPPKTDIPYPSPLPLNKVNSCAVPARACHCIPRAKQSPRCKQIKKKINTKNMTYLKKVVRKVQIISCANTKYDCIRFRTQSNTLLILKNMRM